MASMKAMAEDHQHCLICYSDLVERGKTPCRHDDICGPCHLRLRHLHSDTQCPICKTSNEKIIIDSVPGKSYEEYEQWGDDLGSGYVYQDGIFFAAGYYQKEIVPLFGYACGKCDYDPTSSSSTPGNGTAGETAPKGKKSPYQLLLHHLKTKHKTQLCNLCVKHKRDFVSQLPRYTQFELQNHMKKGDGLESGFMGHPICEFCKPTRFYSLQELHAHLHKDHYRCHVCDKQGIPDQYFKHYASLERHFDLQHFLCQDRQCLEARFVVFENELDLRAHERSVHGGTSGNTKINLAFSTKRGSNSNGSDTNHSMPSRHDFDYNVDGTPFSPPALPTTSPSVSGELHPQHVERTAQIQAQAEHIRQEQNRASTEESFPTLSQSNNASSKPLSTGWSSTQTARLSASAKPAGKVTEEEFPSLAAPSKKKAPSLNHLRPGVKAAPRAGWSGVGANRAAAPRPMGGMASAIGASPSRPPNVSSADQFPSLGGASTPYTAANAFVRAQQQRSRAPVMNSAQDFPTLGGGGGGGGRQTSNVAPKGPSQQQASNMLKPPPSTKEATATIQEIKTTLGTQKFKQLKRLTQEFASDNLSPEGYIDQSATLFEGGYDDPNFWSFVPLLLQDFPNTDTATRALSYMQSLNKRQQQHTLQKKKPAIGSSWGKAPAPTTSAWTGGGSASNNSGSKKKKNSKQELRSLAFGR